MSEELIIEVDKNDKKIGLRPRSDFYTGEHIHRASHLILFNLEGKILLPKRAKTKKWYPLHYDYAVGGTVGNETYRNCIQREILEELGIEIPVERAFKYFSLDKGIDAAFRTVFVGRTNQQIKPNEEVDSIKWVSQEELIKNIKQNSKNYAPYLSIGLEKYFSIVLGI